MAFAAKAAMQEQWSFVHSRQIVAMVDDSGGDLLSHGCEWNGCQSLSRDLDQSGRLGGPRFLEMDTNFRIVEVKAARVPRGRRIVTYHNTAADLETVFNHDGHIPHIPQFGLGICRRALMTLRTSRPNARVSAGTRAKFRVLTSREAEVLTWVARGKSAWEIGEILLITKRTVDEHVKTAARKIGATNRTHAVAIAIRDRLIDI
jgi:DNA-binding CsgD family transcriptional regulator